MEKGIKFSLVSLEMAKIFVISQQVSISNECNGKGTAADLDDYSKSTMNSRERSIKVRRQYDTS